MVAAGAWAGGGGGGGIEGEKVPFAELPSAPSVPPPPPPPAAAASPAGAAGVGAAAGVKRQRDEESGEFASLLSCFALLEMGANWRRRRGGNGC